MSKTVTTSTITKLKTAKDSLNKVSTMFKKAQEGQMGPDEVKEFAEEAVQVLEQAEELIETVAEEVPASEPTESSHLDEDERILESQIEEEEDEEKKSILRSKLATLKLAKSKQAAIHNPEEDEKTAQEKEDEEEKKEMQSKIGKLEKTITEMQYKTAKEKIAQEYASLWSGKQQNAKYQTIMKSKDALNILEAKLSEAKSLLGSSKTKVASTPDESWRKPKIYSTDNTKQKSASQGIIPSSFVNI